ncbi:thioredoxin domain-containing protein [Streptococcus agalactiae]|uniref:bacteriocin transport accessory protein n=1 Tax=Streptococcus agalactiae TaxID=1311 RepID=UPI00046CA14C|nr:bacteriocin transport accessory protein [Streptococcus agalactiae]
MIKKLLLSLIAILCLTTLKSNLSSADTMTISQQQYQHMITNSDLIAITDKALVSKSQQSEATIFIGRQTCQYCRAFLPKLLKSKATLHSKIYYLDSQNYKGKRLKSFFKKHHITTVPNLAHYQRGKMTKYLVQGSQATPQQIQTFLSQK